MKATSLSKKDGNEGFLRLQVAPLLQAISFKTEKQTHEARRTYYHNLLQCASDQNRSRSSRSLENLKEPALRLNFRISRAYAQALVKMKKEKGRQTFAGSAEHGESEQSISGPNFLKAFRRHSSYVKQVPFEIKATNNYPRQHNNRSHCHAHITYQKRRKVRNAQGVSLKDLRPVNFRRKSCCCSSCGKLSRLEEKTLHLCINVSESSISWKKTSTTVTSERNLRAEVHLSPTSRASFGKKSALNSKLVTLKQTELNCNLAEGSWTPDGNKSVYFRPLQILAQPTSPIQKSPGSRVITPLSTFSSSPKHITDSVFTTDNSPTLYSRFVLGQHKEDLSHSVLPKNDSQSPDTVSPKHSVLSNSSVNFDEKIASKSFKPVSRITSKPIKRGSKFSSSNKTLELFSPKNKQFKQFSPLCLKSDLSAMRATKLEGSPQSFRIQKVNTSRSPYRIQLNGPKRIYNESHKEPQSTSACRRRVKVTSKRNVEALSFTYTSERRHTPEHSRSPDHSYDQLKVKSSSKHLKIEDPYDFSSVINQNESSNVEIQRPSQQFSSVKRKTNHLKRQHIRQTRHP